MKLGVAGDGGAADWKPSTDLCRASPPTEKVVASQVTEGE